MKGEIGHVHGIDELRAIAAFMVVFFHLETPGFNLGWAGVQLFFVLSGFLITRILLASKDAHQSGYFSTFYTNRALRIFPLYYLYFAIALGIALGLRKSIADAPWYLIYIQNFTLGVRHFSTQLLMGQTWSLAVEEQFYLIWPLVIWLTPRRHLAKLAVFLVALGPLSRILINLVWDNQFLMFASLPSNVDALALGALLAIHEQHPALDKFKKHLLAVSAIALAVSVQVIGYSRFRDPEGYGKGYLGPLFLLVLALFCFSLVNLARFAPRPRSAAGIRPVLVFLGKISYGVYMYHSLAIIIGHRLVERIPGHDGVLGQVLTTCAGLGLTTLIAWLSFRYFESWFLRMKRVHH